MIQSVELINFRKFARFHLALRSGNILVGPNNAGKSSILDAFRILDACCRNARKRTPKLLDLGAEGVFDGYEVPESVLPFRLANTTYNYSDEDAVLIFHLSSKSKCLIRLHPHRLTRFYIDEVQGNRLTTSSRFLGCLAFNLVLVPTLSPLEADEPYVQDETVRRNAGTRLASRQLRNVWLREPDEAFESFKKDVEDAWTGVRLHKPEMVRGQPPIVTMFFSENRIDREVQWAGFGFQVWLQIQTHIRRGNASSILIIDEPDIYLHPDLQRRLLGGIRKRFRQFVMATHSIEIINDAEVNEIVSVAAPFRTGRRIRSDKEYEAIYQHLGSAANADFARIARARRVVFVEGQDGRILRKLASILDLAALSDASNVPIVPLGGFSRWRRAEDAAWAFKQVFDLDVEIFCLFDRDYRSDAEVEAFCESVRTRSLEFYVLDRKEIENYLLVPSALQRAVQRRLATRKESTQIPTVEQVNEWLLEAANLTKAAVMAHRGACALRYERDIGSKRDDSVILRESNRRVEETWNHEMLSLAPGKEVLARLNDRLQNQLQVSITETQIIEGISRSTLDGGLASFLKRLDAFCDPKT
jgi:hypothetical protein